MGRGGQGKTIGAACGSDFYVTDWMIGIMRGTHQHVRRHAKPNGSSCSLENRAVTAVWIRRAVRPGYLATRRCKHLESPGECHGVINAWLLLETLPIATVSHPLNQQMARTHLSSLPLVLVGRRNKIIYIRKFSIDHLSCHLEEPKYDLLNYMLW